MQIALSCNGGVAEINDSRSCDSFSKLARFVRVEQDVPSAMIRSDKFILDIERRADLY